jgi:hypothetical protein
MHDFRVAIGLVLAIEALLMTRFTGSAGTGRAIFAREVTSSRTDRRM